MKNTYIASIFTLVLLLFTNTVYPDPNLRVPILNSSGQHKKRQTDPMEKEQPVVTGRLIAGSKKEFTPFIHKRILTRIGKDQKNSKDIEIKQGRYIVLEKKNGSWDASDPSRGRFLGKIREVEKLFPLGDHEIRIHLLGRPMLFKEKQLLHPYLLDLYIDDNNETQYQIFYSEILSDGSLDLYITQDLFDILSVSDTRAVLLESLGQGLESADSKAGYGLVSGDLFNDIAPYIQDDLNKWEQIKDTTWQEARYLEGKLAEKGIVDLRPMFEMGSGAHGYNFKFFIGIESKSGRKIVVKIDPDSDLLVSRFGDHDMPGTGIMAVYGGGVLPDDGRKYAILEYIEGEPVENIIAREEDFSVEEIVDIMLKLLEGLKGFHGQKLAHKDISIYNTHIDMANNEIGVTDPLLDRVGEYDENNRLIEFDKYAKRDLADVGDLALRLLTHMVYLPDYQGDVGGKRMSRSEINSLILNTNPELLNMKRDAFDVLVDIFYDLSTGRSRYDNADEVMADLQLLRQKLQKEAKKINISPGNLPTQAIFYFL